MRLNSKLVTLSACDTGVGPVGETGVVNLVNAFIGAGAHSVVSTLWELADQPTSRLMKTFYAGLADHESKGEALRNAQLELLKDDLPPYYWASFQLVGDARRNALSEQPLPRSRLKGIIGDAPSWRRCTPTASQASWLYGRVTCRANRPAVQLANHHGEPVSMRSMLCSSAALRNKAPDCTGALL